VLIICWSVEAVALVVGVLVLAVVVVVQAECLKQPT